MFLHPDLIILSNIRSDLYKRGNQPFNLEKYSFKFFLFNSITETLSSLILPKIMEPSTIFTIFGDPKSALCLKEFRTPMLLYLV